MLLHRPARLAALLVAATALGAGEATPYPAIAPGAPPDVERLAQGVHAVVRREPLGLALNANSLVVIQDSGVLVVDAQFTREATLETIAAIRRLTPKPVRWVVNTHWHDDHVAGNSVYRDSFPGVRFVIHANTRRDLELLGAPNRIATRDGAPAVADRYDRLLQLGLGIDSTPASDAERESVGNALRIVRRYFVDLRDFQLATEGPAVQHHLRIGNGATAVDLHWFGRGNTAGDLVAHVPAAGVVATGDLLVHPVPLAFGSYPREWTAVLDSIAALRPRAILPGHGAVQRDLAWLHRLRTMLADVAAGTDSAVRRGDSLAAIRARLTLDGHRAALTGGEKWATWMWNNFFLGPAVTQAHQQATGRRGALAVGSFVITGVNVVPMTADTVLRGMSVLVTDGRIRAIGRDIAPPIGVRTIDGTGKYLIPGLADMHTHLFSDDALADSLAPVELGVMLSQGITAARLMIGTPEQLRLRRAVTDGAILGPQLWLASPQLAGRAFANGITVTTAEQARAAVRSAADSGYDFVKLTLFITPEVHDAVVDEAAKRRIRVVGHVDPQVGLARAISARQQIEHLDGYFEAALPDTAPMKLSVTQQGVFAPANWRSLDFIDDRVLDSLAGATARARVWSGPTLHVFNTAFAAKDSDDTIRSRPEWELLPPAWRDGYLRARDRYWSDGQAGARGEARHRRYVEIRNRLVKGIVDSGGRILAGSDTPEWFNLYGYGLHRELGAYVAAGLTPYQALVTATRNPAEYLGQLSEWGTIEPGKRADLVLLDANPLQDIVNVSRIAGVAVGGRWLARGELDAMILAARRSIGGR